MPSKENINERFWENLLELIADRRVVPVLGPGLLYLRQSDSSKHSLYRILAGLLAARLGASAEKLPAGGELNAIACRYLEAGGDMEDVYINLKAVISKTDEYDPLRFDF